MYMYCLLLLMILELTSTSRLQFNNDGKFKILQVSDLHFWDGSVSACFDIARTPYICNNWNSTTFIRDVIKSENPDLILFSGDTVDEGAFDGKWSMDQAFKPAYETDIPWAAVLGNHDQEAGLFSMGRKKVMEYVCSLPGENLSQMGPSSISGFGNYKLQIFQGDELRFNIFMIDSLDFAGGSVFSKYDWIKQSQIQWYLKNVDYNSKNEQVPSIAVFHIPIPEFLETVQEGNNYTGDKFDGVSSSKINSGIFSAFLESGDVKIVLVGHNHINDYCSFFNGIQLCFAGGSGFGSYGKEGWPRRVRIIELQDYGDIVVSWKRLNEYPDIGTKDNQILWVKL